MRIGQLTTPVPYISTIPLDTFAGPVDKNNPGSPLNTFSYGTNDTGRLPTNAQEAAQWQLCAQQIGMLPGDYMRFQWYLRSYGPDNKQEYFGNIDPDENRVFDLRYDPTNGTTSRGDVIRTNMGVAGN